MTPTVPDAAAALETAPTETAPKELVATEPAATARKAPARRATPPKSAATAAAEKPVSEAAEATAPEAKPKTARGGVRRSTSAASGAESAPNDGAELSSADRSSSADKSSAQDESPSGAKSGSARTGSARAGASRSRATKAATEADAETAPTTTATAKAGTSAPLARVSPLAPLFQAPDLPPMPERSISRPAPESDEAGTVRRRTRRRSGEEGDADSQQPNTVVKVRQPRQQPAPSNEPQRVKGSTRLEAKKQRRRDGRDAGRRRPVITEAEFLARRESVDRAMVVRSKADRIQIGVLEDGVLVEHYVAKAQDASLIGNVYLGRVQNVLPSMEAAFVDIGRGRNAVLYSGEVDWDAAAENSAEGKQQARRIELALKPGDKVLVQVTKDPVGHKGARLTSQVSLPGRYLVYVPNGSMNGISRKLPDTERARLKKILKEVLPENVGVIVRTAAEGATEEQLTLDVNRLTAQWAEISAAVENVQAPALLHSEPDLLVKIVRDVFNEDFHKLVVAGDDAMATIQGYLSAVAPDLADRVEKYLGQTDAFDEFRISEQIEKALDRKVWLPSGGSLVIDRTEAMTVVDVNTGKFVGSGGNLEETVTKNNLEAAEEIVRQLRLRDIGGIIVVDFIDMVLESNRDLVLRRLVECLSRDRTKHQVAEVTSLGLVQMTRKKLGLGLLESFSEPCEVCSGRGIIVHHDPVTKHRQSPQPEPKRGRNRGGQQSAPKTGNGNGGTHAITEDAKNALAKIAASTIAPVVELGDQPLPTAESGAPVEAADQARAQGPAQAQSHAAASSSRDNASNSRSSSDRSTGSSAGSTGGGSGSRRASSASVPAANAGSEEAGASGSGTSSSGSADAGSRGSAAAGAASFAPPANDDDDVPVAILDIPVTKSTRPARKISAKDAEQLLGSVLDALPEPAAPGTGRARTSRRATSAGLTSAPPPTTPPHS